MTELLGIYTINEEISEDLLSFSYLCTEKYTGQVVLLWRVKDTFLSVSDLPALFDSCETLLTLKHDHILPLLNYHYDGQSLYLVYQFPEDLIALDAYLLQKKQWPLRAIYSVCTQLLSALQFLESSSCYHGYLMLGGIYLTKKGHVYLPNSLVFSQVLSANFHHLEGLEEGQFFAPEFLQHQQLSSKSDIFSFGVLIYFLFTQKWPFGISHTISTLKKSVLKPIIAPNIQRDSMSQKLSTLIETCLLPDPEKRFDSVSTLFQVFKGESELPKEESVPQVSQTVHQEISDGLKQALGRSILKRLLFFLVTMVPLSLLYGVWFLYTGYLTAIPLTTIPEIEGLPIDVVERILKERKLKLRVIGRRDHPIIPQDFVLESRPPSGRDVKQNRTIQVFLSNGVRQVLVPNFIGKTLEQAFVLEQSVQLPLISSENVYSFETKGTIVDQSPTPNTLVPVATTINVVLSEGTPVQVTTNVSAYDTIFFTPTVVVHAFIPSDWESHHIRIYRLRDSGTEELFSETVSSENAVSFPVELKKNDRLEVYYNKELAAKYLQRE